MRITIYNWNKVQQWKKSLVRIKFMDETIIYNENSYLQLEQSSTMKKSLVRIKFMDEIIIHNENKVHRWDNYLQWE